MLPLLVACACPTFDDMVVEDVDGTASSETVDAARAALASFAAWTEDEGVCVPGIDLVDDVAEPLFLDEGYAAGGEYRGRRRTIRISTQFPSMVGTSTFHELCHATDKLEGHADALAWPEVADRAIYEGEDARNEDFAMACQGGAPDVVLDTALVERCGAEPLLDDVDRYLADVVFPGAPRMDLAQGELALTDREWTWEGVPSYALLLDAAPYDGGVALLELRAGTLLVEVRDATLAEVRATVVLETGVDNAEGAFVPADEGLFVRVLTMVVADGSFSWSQHTLGVDPPTWSWWTLPVDDALDLAALSDGVAYALDPEWYLHAWTLDGGEVDVPQPPTLADPLGMFPTEGGVGIVDAAALHVLDADAGAWKTTSLLPRVATAWADLGGGRVVVLSGSVRLLYDDGAWAFLGDPCADDGSVDPWYVEDVVPVGADRLLALPEGGEDADGDGVVERLVTEMTIGG